MYYMFITFVKVLLIVIPLLISVAYFTLAERKILGAIQRRRGPNVVGVYGILQPLSDGFKLLVKEIIIPSNSNKGLFLLAPIITFFISLMGWAVIPYSPYGTLSDLNIGLLYILAVSSLGVYGIIISGWSSNSKYAFLGALRSAAQMVSYEISLGFILITIILTTGSFNLPTIIIAQSKVWYIIPFFPLFLIFFVSGLAETNRHPFDLPEAEAELVSGYNVEYSAMGFALFSLGEYSNMLLMSSICVILFIGGWSSPSELVWMIFLQYAWTSYLCRFYHILAEKRQLRIRDALYLYFEIVAAFYFVTSPILRRHFFDWSNGFWFGIKICIFVIAFVWMRAILPRYRYDQLMNLGWKSFLPISIIYLLFSAFILITFNYLPF